MKRRVVITGMGTVNPLGLTVAETWENIKGGASGVGPITLFDSSNLNTHIACEVKGFDPESYMQRRNVRRSDRFEQFAVAAFQEAIVQSGFKVQEERADKVAVTISTAVGGLDTMQMGAKTIAEDGPRRVSPFLIPMFMPNGASGLIAIEMGAKGPCFSLASACASGADSLGQSTMMIRSGLVEVAIAGGAEAPISILGVSAFERLGACSSRNEAPYTTPRPFDANRDGLVVGEGAGVLVLESLEHAQARGAQILAELVGYAATADAFHVTAPSEDGAGGAAAIIAALQDAGRRMDEVDYINAHGTATQLNDVSETRAIKSALGEDAYRVPISSTKSMTGHLMGATGALEAIFCIQAIREGIIPPTINLMEPDPECDLDYVPGVAREGKVELALSNAFGFGGHNAVLAFQAFSG